MIDKDWDILIIFDSCRFDIFRDTYQEIFSNGKLTKRTTNITSTEDWLIDTFGGKDCSNIVYMCPIYSLKDWIKTWPTGKESFHKVVEVWRTSWNRKLETVLPDDMTNISINTIKEHNNKRHVIHFMQPHHPYLYWGGHDTKDIALKPILTDKAPVKTKSYKRKFADFIEGICPETFWRFTGRLGLLPEWNLGYIWYKHGRKGVLKGYTEDLKYVMKCAKKISETFPDKKVVISADHGEELGDGRIRKIYRMNHKLQRPRTKQVLEVPWYEL